MASGSPVVEPLEHSLLRVPYESLNRTFRATQKLLEKEISLVLTSLKQASSGREGEGNRDEVLASVAGRLAMLKRRLRDACSEEEKWIRVCRQRLDHLDDGHVASNAQRWSQQRLNRYVVDHILRQGHHVTAQRLAQETNVTEMVDFDVFERAHAVQESLRRREFDVAFQWCNLQKSRLKKLNSPLEFELRVQEFVELCRVRDTAKAIKYSRVHFAGSVVEERMGEIEKAMALLAFGPETQCDRYQAYYSDARWDSLLSLFALENFRVHSIVPQSALSMTLQAGLSALKTPMCYDRDKSSANCPVCTPLLNQMALTLPFSQRGQSCLVCQISGDIMNEDNPPMVLPNGYAYGKKALEAMGRECGGRITCPRTKEVFRLRDAKKVFVM